jgi:cysteine desulfuration protein SufE
MNLQKTPELTLLYEKKQKSLLELFPEKDPQKTYEKIIKLGKELPSPKKDIQNEVYLVQGCQSLAYLTSSLTPEGNIEYEAHSEALISRGLAALLFFIYNYEKPELTFLYPPLFIQELGLHTSLSPGRSNGLISMYSRMKTEALTLFLKQTTPS